MRDSVLTAADFTETDELSVIIEAVCSGDTVLFVDGFARVILLSSKNFTLRSIQEPEGERVLSGPREGFNEGIITNLSMVRRRLLTHQLKMRMMRIGVQSKTTVCVVYMDNIVNHDILREVYRRLEGIQLDVVLDANYLIEYIADQSFCGFPTIGTTERPDVVVGKLMEGRIAIFVDGTPVVLTAPFLLLENFQSSEN